MTLAGVPDSLESFRQSSEMNPSPAQPQQVYSHYPPPLSDDQRNHDYVETATAALSSAQPHSTQIEPQHGPPSAETPTLNARKPRKAAVPGSRGVANLTPDQLAKKRINDRDAQRAIRERTKGTIETLERRIRELESQQPYQELQHALADRDRALADCEELRKRLAAVAGIVGNREIGQTGLNGMAGGRTSLHDHWLTISSTELAALTVQQSPLPLSVQPQSQHFPAKPTTSEQLDTPQPPLQQNLHPDLRTPQRSNDSTSPTPG